MLAIKPHYKQGEADRILSKTQHFQPTALLSTASDIRVQYFLTRKGNTNHCEPLLQFPHWFSPSPLHRLLRKLTTDTGRGEDHAISLKSALPMQLTVAWFQYDTCLQQSLLSIKTRPLIMQEEWSSGTVIPGLSAGRHSHCVHLQGWRLASATGLVWHQGNLRAALYCYFTSPSTVFVLNDVLCDLMVFAEMMKASAWCAVLCDCCLLLETRYYFAQEFPKRQP